MPIVIDVDFPLLEKAVKAMGAEDLDVLFEKLKKGIPVSKPSDFESKDGLLSCKGFQIILYIQDHTHRNMFEEAIEDGGKGNRFHVAYCKKLQEMWTNDRGKRYVVTNNLSEKFVIKGKNDEAGKAKLQVCKHCLRKLNYSNYRNRDNRGRDRIVKEFHLPIFFETYASYFSTLPSRRAGDREDYTDDWLEVSWSYREKQNFTCEGCGVNLSQGDDHELLHTHHIDGVKSDNSEDNLQALCVDCHRRQPYHQHMNNNEMFRENIGQINRLRQKQGLSPPPK